MDLLKLYDREEREHAAIVGMRREEAPELVRQVDLVGTSSTVLYSKMAAEDLDRVIEREAAYFAALGHDLEWKAYAHDAPSDLVERLRAHGFACDEREAIVVLDVDHAPTSLLEPPLGVRRVKKPEDLRALMSIFKPHRPDAADRLIGQMREAPAELSVYVAEVDGQTASCGWVRFPVGTSFASLWGGSTLPQFRKRGAYTRLVAARVQEARQRGFRYVTVDAGAMSRPILEKRGFRVLTWATACHRRVSSGTG
jgi:GNAT superfamily N-acetyltransferase